MEGGSWVEMQHANMQVQEKEWEKLLKEARELGITPTEIRNFFKQKKLNLSS
ncbi:anti-repressor SinI family protein [Evansella tamaricis]|uniref:Anti-repressor SinI family protein n=1 Tax=Evansella tamaricis TaxID=2069301 RepID=A0ABS6JIU0_9BACI|nr:anti-repressor SinI family protein [Evansella tamaricis]MBU9713599.1 anti-repressor SinI family protein [Evansella tamaricis]